MRCFEGLSKIFCSVVNSKIIPSDTQLGVLAEEAWEEKTASWKESHCVIGWIQLLSWNINPSVRGYKVSL